METAERFERVYGVPDPDPTLMRVLRRHASEQGASRLIVMAHQRQPPNALPCKKPGSVTYEFQLDGDKAYGVRQEANGDITWLGL